MKKLLLASVILAAILAACTKKVVPATTTTAPDGTEKPATTTAPAKTEAEIKADIEAKAKVEEADKAPVAKPVMSEMDMGKSIITGKCANCHAAKNPGDFTFFRWQSILRSMVPKAKLNSEEERQLTAYIQANAKQ